MWWRRLAIRLALPISWRLSRRRRADVLQRFAVTEADSAWHFLHALSHVDQPGIRARLFNNALEEIHHATLFEQAAREEARAPIHLPIEERCAIFDPRKGLQHFYAFVFVGEKDVYDQFDAYASAIAAGSVRRIFTQLKEDEGGHMQFAQRRLEAMKLDYRVVSREMRAIRRRRLVQSWGRGLRAVADTVTTFLLSALYFSLGGLSLASSRRAHKTGRYARPGRRAGQ